VRTGPAAAGRAIRRRLGALLAGLCPIAATAAGAAPAPALTVLDYRNGQYLLSLGEMDGRPARTLLAPVLRSVIAPERPAEAAIANAAVAPRSAGDFRTALLRQALEEAQQQDGVDSLAAANAANALGNAYYARSEFAQAVPYYRRDLAIRDHRLGVQHVQVAVAAFNLASAYSGIGESAGAQKLAMAALAIYENAFGADDPRLLPVLNGLAMICYEAGNHAQALAFQTRHLAIVLRTSGPEGAAAALSYNELGIFNESLGRYALALEDYRHALAIQERLHGPDSAAATQPMFNLAQVYVSLGKPELALPMIEHAERNDEQNIGTVNFRVANKLGSLAGVLCSLGRCQEALPVALRAVQIAEHLDAPNNLKLSSTYLTLARVYRQLGRDADAQPLIERVLDIRRRVQGPYHPQVAAMLFSLADLRMKAHDVDGARALLLQALPIVARGDHPEMLWKIEAGMRSTARGGAAREEAIYWGKAAVNTIQSMRASLHEVDEDLQSAFVRDRSGPYKRLAALLIDAGRLPEAEQVLALLKDHERAQLIRRGDGPRPGAELVGAERAAQDDYEKLVTGSLEHAQELDALERRARYEKLSDADEARRRNLADEATDWRADFKKWLAALPARLGAGSGAAAPSTTDILKESGSLSNVVKADPGAIGLYYVVTDDYVSVIIATARGSFGRRIDVGAVELNHRIAALRQALTDPLADPRPAATAMYHTLIDPIAADLDAAKPRTLVLSLTDNLRYIPFAALYDGRHYLVERYAVAQLVAGSHPRTDPSRTPWQVAAFGMTQAAPPLDPLRGVRDELESIVRVPGGTRGVLPGTISLDQDFDREHFEQALRGEHRVLHVGSHFVLSASGDEDSSYLLLGDRSHLSLSQIATLDFSSVDQLTLSACNTASGGGKDENGMEVEGMASVVATQGASSVLASLWPVSDESTASLMHAFYAGRSAGDGLPRAQALQQAQLALLRGAGTAAGPRPGAPASSGTPRGGAPAPFVPDPAQPFAHPFFWAPFIIMGNWL